MTNNKNKRQQKKPSQ